MESLNGIDFQTLLLKENGISNAGTHHKPLKEECEECDQNYHIEGKINGNIKFQDSDDIMQSYEISAMYAMDVKLEDNLSLSAQALI